MRTRWLLSVLASLLLAAPAVAQVGVAIPSGQTVTVDAHGECRQVTNPGSGTRMVFTGTAAEWASFRNNPNGLILATCLPPCGGVVVGGYCWYTGGYKQSCDAACADRGGCNLEGTRDYAGTGGTDANCASVLDALGMGAGSVQRGYGGVTINVGTGCAIIQQTRIRHLNHPTTCNAPTFHYRACACYN